MPSVKIQLGACSAYALFGQTTFGFNGALTVITTLNIGISPAASITGLSSALVKSGSVQLNTASAANCVSSLTTSYNAASGATCTTNLGVADMSGKTFLPGVYCNFPGSGTLSTASRSVIVFDAQNNSAATWIFQTKTTLITGANSKMVLKNGALEENIFWAVGIFYNWLNQLSLFHLTNSLNYS